MTTQWNRRRWCSASLGLAAAGATPWLGAQGRDGKGEDRSDGQAESRKGRGGKGEGKGGKGGKRLEFGTAERPFSAQSPWNSRPVDPELGDYEIPKDSYFPTIDSAKWSTGVFVCSRDDKPMRLTGLPGRPGIWDPDAEATQPELVIPHWPERVLPATGSDGHADLVDPVAGVVHSFFKLQRIDGEWRAAQYAWSRLDGRGWGDPAHYFQGARAAAVPSMGGVMRTHELDDGDTMFRHALAMSMTFSGLSADPGYVFPATSADKGANRNKGRIPEGALMMLPADFDTSALQEPRLRKIAETLKVYGAYVVDRNIGTPFVFYAEIGSEVRLHPRGGWNVKVARELDLLRASMRQVTGARGYVDGHGEPVDLRAPLNLLSFRGQWKAQRGEAASARFETWRQGLVFTDATPDTLLVNEGRRPTGVHWARPKPGQRCRFTARCEGDARVRLQMHGGGKALFDSGELGDGQRKEFDWPDADFTLRLGVRCGGSGLASADLRALTTT